MSSTITRHHRRTVVLVVLLAIALVIALVIVLVGRSGDDSDGSAPYRDRAVTGSIALCDKQGHQVRTGSVTAAPFAWRAVGATAAPPAYAGTAHSATLYAFQPRAGVDPTGWSGRALTASAQYSNVAHPMAAATDADVALNQFLAGYPPVDHGFVQLRLYLGAAEQAPRTTSYDALDLRITGATWRAVGGSSLSCTSGTSVSFETAVGSHP